MLRQSKPLFAGTQAPALRRALVAAVSVAAFCSVRLFAAPAENEVNFTFSADPGKVVLVYSSYGANTGIETIFTLYGNGRLEYRSVAHPGELRLPEPLLQDEFLVEYHEMEELLRLVIDHGLSEASAESVQDKVKALTSGRPPLEIDCGYSTIEISLTTYSRGKQEYGAVHNSITLFCPTLRSRRYNLKEYHGFRLLSERLRVFYTLAEERVAEQSGKHDD